MHDASDMITPPIIQFSQRHQWQTRVLRWFLALATPVLLILISTRLIMTPVFLQLEYQRPGFPPDPYGLTQQERLTYAPYLLNFLLNSADISYLGDLTFPDGSRLFNERELRHMVDVKVVTQTVFAVTLVVGLLALAAGYWLWRTPTTRVDLRQALENGGRFTVGLIVSIVLLALVSWDIAFTGFHSLFFEAGTWRFYTSDTLIRLFPEQFWFDAALVIGALTLLGAGLLFVISWRWQPQKHL